MLEDPGAAALAAVAAVVARGQSPAAFDGRCIPPPTPTGWETPVGGPGPGGVAHRLHSPAMRALRAWPSGRLNTQNDSSVSGQTLSAAFRKYAHVSGGETISPPGAARRSHEPGMLTPHRLAIRASH